MCTCVSGGNIYIYIGSALIKSDKDLEKQKQKKKQNSESGKGERVR